jgi:diguanylate cyclase (GGDEF)-like protein
MVTDLSIIVVDDMQFSRAVLRSGLNKSGYTDVRMAASGSEALAMLDERSADVVLADWVMPEMNGLELTEAIRAKDEATHRYTSVILFTAKEGSAAMMQAFQRGVDDYLTKPVAETELAARVYAAGRVSTLQNTLLETSAALSAANKHLEELATTDPLTGLGNRRYLHRHLESLLQTARNRGGGLCIAIIDIDHFKQINDSWGHDIGDEVLAGFARRLLRAIRPTDLLARLGGEEFALVMYYPAMHTFRPSIFDRILESISGRPIQTSETSITLTASIGVHCYVGSPAEPPVDLNTILKAADSNLYIAKQNGRNRVVGTN